MKVLHVIPSLSPRHGGPTFAVRGMAHAVSAIGGDVTVAATTADGTGELRVATGEPMTEGGVRYVYFPRQYPKQWSASWPLAVWLRRAVADFDVVHVHSLFSFPTLAAAAAARHARVPYVLRPLGSVDPWSLARRRLKKQLYLRLIERRNLARAAAVHATSDRERRSLETLDRRLRIAVVPIGVDVGPRAVRRGAAVVAGEPVRLLFLSRLHQKKGLELLIEALTSLRDLDWRLDIVGDGDAAYVAQLRRSVDERRLADRIAFRGFAVGDDKRRLLDAADVFVLPSYDENFGLAVAEAMAASLPVIVSRDVALSPDVVESRAGLSVSLNAGELAAAIAALIGDSDLRRDMGANARVLASRRFAWPVVARQLADLYERVAADRRAIQGRCAPGLA